jgi:hypothetical protein
MLLIERGVRSPMAGTYFERAARSWKGSFHKHEVSGGMGMVCFSRRSGLMYDDDRRRDVLLPFFFFDFHLFYTLRSVIWCDLFFFFFFLLTWALMPGG